jgi:MFS family permease
MRWRVLAWICLAELGALSLWFSATAAIPALHTTWMSTDAQAWLSMAVTLGFVAGTVASAVLTLADFVGARRLFVVSAIGGALVNAALLIVIESLPLVLASRFLTGIAMAGTYPPAMKLAASWFVTDRGLAVGSLVGALTIGGALPHLINFAGGLAWWPVIAGTSGAALGAALVMATLVRDGPHIQARAPFNPACLGELLRSRGVVLANLGYFGHMWDRRPPSRGARHGRGLLADRIGRTATTMLAMVGSGTCAAVVGLVFDRPVLLVAVALVWGFTIIADSAQFSASVTELAPPAYVGTALSLQTSLGFLLTLVSTWLVPRAVEAWGWPMAFAFLAPGPFLGTLAMGVLRGLPESAKLAQGRR